jgi:tripartite-type tricarboxylate transporter receptor subunit TctC
LTVLINFAAGGPTDIEGRLAARFLGKHIPGQPAVVVQNMPGAGGVIGTNYLGEIAKPDGLTMGYFTGQFFNLLTADPTLRVDLAKFACIASIEESRSPTCARTLPRASTIPRTSSRQKASRRAV